MKSPLHTMRRWFCFSPSQKPASKTPSLSAQSAQAPTRHPTDAVPPRPRELKTLRDHLRYTSVDDPIDPVSPRPHGRSTRSSERIDAIRRDRGKQPVVADETMASSSVDPWLASSSGTNPFAAEPVASALESRHLRHASLSVAERHAGSPAQSSASVSTTVGAIHTEPYASQVEDDGHGAGAIIDLDEAAHGLYAGAKYAIEGLEGHPGHIADVFTDEAHELQHHPISTFLNESVHDTSADFAISMGIGAGMLPLSALAIHAGFKETKEAIHTHRDLTKRLKIVQRQQRAYHALDNTANETVGRGEQVVRERFQQDLTFEKKLNVLDGGIGVSSLTSGSAILAKVAAETGLQGGLAAMAKGTSVAALVEHSAHTAAVATSFGLAGTFALAPLASISATTLGAFFLHQSRLEKKRLGKDIQTLNHFLSQMDVSELSPQALRYLDFLDIKLGQRQRFINRYNNWNKGFVTGSSVYAMSTMAKAGMGAAALAGAGAVGGPIGIGALLGVGTVGALTMGVSSHQYLFSHNKHKRYRNYERLDKSTIDRKFMILVDALPIREDVHLPHAAANGFELRAALYHQMDGQEKVLTELLRQAADQTFKKFRGKTRSTDVPGISAAPDHVAGRLPGNKIHASLSASAAFSRKIVTSGRLSQAHDEARNCYGKHRTKLTEATFEQWLNDPQSQASQIDYMLTALDLKREYLQCKVATRQSRQSLQDPEPLTDSDIQNGSTVDNFQTQLELVKSLENAQQNDQKWLQKANQLHHELHQLSPSSGLDSGQLATLRRRFLTILLADTNNTISDSRSFAKFCFHEASDHITATRGILLSTELQAARLRAQLAGEPRADGASTPPVTTEVSHAAIA